MSSDGLNNYQTRIKPMSKDVDDRILKILKEYQQSEQHGEDDLYTQANLDWKIADYMKIYETFGTFPKGMMNFKDYLEIKSICDARK